MEFPEVGTHCTVKNCKLNDFLPFPCAHCSEIFCKSHFNVLSHNCTKNPDKQISEPTINSTETYNCSDESCKTSTPVQMKCTKCEKHFCLAHRHHGCFEKSEQQISKELENWAKPKEEFVAAKNLVDQEINRNLKKSKNSVMAAKLQLMKIKGKAVGSNGIPTTDRRYFLIYPPLKPAKKEPLAVFVSNTWTIGKVIDTIAALLGLENSNNKQNAIKLRLFHHESGKLIANQMDILLSDLFNSCNLSDGQSVIIEYSDADMIDFNSYK